jgi:peptide/nickel transport system substrate-binding protein
MGYSKLFIFDPYAKDASGKTTWELRGVLVDTWRFEENNTRLTLNLKRGVKWHDGTPFTSKDVIYTLGSVLDPPSPYSSGGLSVILKPLISSFRATDDYTVVLELPKFSNSLLAHLRGFAILPSHLDLETVAEKAIGTGPFKLKSFERDISIDWVRNPDHFGRDDAGRPLPYVDALRVFHFSERTLLFSALRVGRVRYADDNEVVAIQKNTAELERDVPGIQFDWNIAGTFGPIFKNVPPFNDPRVREAIDLWIDRKAVRLIGYPRGSVYDAGLAPVEQGGQWGLPPEEIMSRPGYRLVDSTGKVVTSIEELRAKWDELRKDPRDRERAKELLAEAGIKSGDVKFELVTVLWEAPRSGPPIVAQMKELFGATWTMKTFPTAADFTRDFTEGRWVVADYVNHVHNDDPSLVLSSYYRNTGPTSWIAVGGWAQDPAVARMEQLFNEQDATPDPARRRQLLWEFQRTLLDWRGKINVANDEGVAAYWPELRNIPDNGTAVGDDKIFDRIWLAQ